MDSVFYKSKIDIDKLFEKSPELNDEQKEYFRALAETVNKSQNELFEHIQKYTVSALSGNKECNQVYTLLVTDESQYNDPNNIFVPMLDSDEDEENIVFIDSPYDVVNIFEINEGKIKFEKTDVFVKKEKILSAVFRLYNIDVPYIYSPYSRRAFKVTEFDEKTGIYRPVNFKRDNITIDLENVVYGKLLWNISITPASKIRGKTIPENGTEFIRYENCDESSFIIPDFKDTERTMDMPKFFRRTGEKCIDVLRSSEESENIGLLKVEIKKNIIERKNQFINIFHKDVAAPKRIMTQADIRLAVEKYYENPDEFKGFVTTTNNNAIKDYSRDDRYLYSDLSEVARKNKNLLYLKFSDSGKDNFFIDRVNCFISFMRYNYPNFYWVGLRE